MHTSVHSNIIYKSLDMKATQVAFNRLVDKEEVVYIFNGILLHHKKNEILPFATL